jgi:hypothetical protein
MPKGCEAPFLMKEASKQKDDVKCRNMFIRRLGPSSIARQQFILKNILQDKPISSAIVGLSRIGKTQELNFYAIRLFDELGREGTKLKVLLLRIGSKIYDLRLSVR